MVAGVVAGAGYYMGERLHGPRESNPKGFFESPRINWINEDLLARVLPRRPPLIGRWWHPDRPCRRQRWVARLPVGTDVPCSPRAAARIATEVSQSPFCFKDPRFSYTLPAWRSFLKDTVYICVFRDPMATAASIVKECASMPYMSGLLMNTRIAVEVWRLMYEHILRRHMHEGEWLFVHYDQVLHGDGMNKLERILGTAVNRDFPDSKLRRSVAVEPAPADAGDVYQELCELAGFEKE